MKKPIHSSENPLKYSLTTRFKDRHFIKMLSPIKNKKILDIGCGIGYLSGILNEQGAEVVGIDLELSALKYSAQTLPGLFAFASAEVLPFPENEFDAIIIADVIEHLPNPGKALQEIHRVGKSGARIVVSTPNLKGPLTGTWALSMLHSEQDGHMADYREGYTAESLSELMNSRKIIPVQVSVTNPLISQLFLSMVKLGYRSVKSDYQSQSELISLNRNWKFEFYKRTIFPVGYFLGRMEERLLRNLIEGHCLIVCGTIDK